MTVKLLATGAAAVAAIGAAAAGVTCVAAGPTSGHPAALPVQPAALGVPFPQDPPLPNLPSPDQLSSLCNQVTDPGVSYTTKQNLVQGGISPNEGHAADHDLRDAFQHGNFPEQFNVTNIQPAGPNGVTADVAITGPKFAGPVTKNLAAVNEGGNWILQHDAAIALVQAASAIH
jgi:hypothetical protein